MNFSDCILHNNKRIRFNPFPNSSVLPRKQPKYAVVNKATLYISPLEIPLISTASNSSCESFCLQPYKPFTIGRKSRRCEFVFNDRRVSKQHCQLFFDQLNRKIFIADGLLFVDSTECSAGFRVSLNGVFVNGVRIGRGEVSELHAGDEVSLACDGACSLGIRTGFVIEKIIFLEEVLHRHESSFRLHGMPSDHFIAGQEYVLSTRANFLLSRCKRILCSDDPLLSLRDFGISCHEMETIQKDNNNFGLISSNVIQFPMSNATEQKFDAAARRVGLSPIKVSITTHNSEGKQLCMGKLSSIKSHRETAAVPEANPGLGYIDVNDERTQRVENMVAPLEKGTIIHKTQSIFLHSEETMGDNQRDKVVKDKNKGAFAPPPGSKFYLNRLKCMSNSTSGDHATVSLPELLYPVESLVRVFIATFTSDILWFLSYCKIPTHLPVTIACHNSERCWSSDLDNRTSIPFPNFPNLVLVYPPFPEVIAFGNNRKKSGIACHHPKLFILQREDNIRVIITSANLVANQWHNVTNTVWWQDFPRASAPDYLNLFTQSCGEMNLDSNNDFAAQLSGFVASLVADVPCQAYWVMELPKYDFKGAVGHLVASVPGIYSHKAPYILKSMHYLPDDLNVEDPCGGKLLGTVKASLLGLSRLFRSSADSNGAQLKKLASFLGKSHENVYGMSEIVLRRNMKIPADANAVSVLIPSPKEFPARDFVQVGFLPRSIAKWVAPLSDIGLFSFSGYIYPKEVLETAMEGSNNSVQLILYVSKGSKFLDILEVLRPEHVSAICSLVASIQRCVGLWRLQEVLGHYKWPENLETEFIFGSSSVGSVNAQFLAAFSAAAGKQSLRVSESEESDPDWGCWSASQELKNPSVRIIFPTIERVRNASSGILSSKRILCFSWKAWERLGNTGILHDAIPYPSDRVGHPMHVKVARRRFQSTGDASSFGWVYCGSHNFSAAAWGRPICNSYGTNSNGSVRSNSVLGSRLHICNYELGIVFIVTDPDKEVCAVEKRKNLDDITLPFVVPAPKYRPSDRPATAQTMREALAELTERERVRDAEAGIAVELEEEIPAEEEEVLGPINYGTHEMEDEKVYADILWGQIHSS